MNYTKMEGSDAPEFVDTRQAPEAIPVDKSSQHSPLHQQPPGAYDYQFPDAAPENSKPDGKTRESPPRRIAGLHVWVFWLIIGIIGVVVIGASVGGAVGGTQSSKGQSDPTTTVFANQPQSTPNSASSGSSASSTGGSAPSSQQTADTVYTPATRDCPGSDGQTYTPFQPSGGQGQYTFTKDCEKNWAEGKWDITQAFVQSFDLCIDMCSSWNYFDHPGGEKCAGVVFQASGAPPGNCWIKNSSLVRNGLEQSDNTDIALLNDS
ncbi:hypothetical protein PRZ48_006017 [Zasmidium cellare]|uniref:Uncharacterized protein n=1 Tax=Zasmidium cellare TaxID=395010 RepID=A0ABR0ELY0_ZASCE|nr:hypothetical protein PRZ48_006017 [Zasmidium cellare]